MKNLLQILLTGFVLSFASPLLLAQAPESGRRINSIYVGGGPIISPGLVLADFKGGILFRNGWGLGADYSRHDFRHGTPGVDPNANSGSTSWARIDVIKQIRLRPKGLRIHLAAGLSAVEKKRHSSSEESFSNYPALQTKAALFYRVNHFFALSGGLNLNTGSEPERLGGEVSILLGSFGEISTVKHRKDRPQLALELLSADELKELNENAIVRYKRSEITGGIFVGLALASAIIGIHQIQKDSRSGFLPTGSEVAGGLLIVSALGIFSPIATIHLVNSSKQQKKSQKILKLLR